jgi:hypothetical protein
MTFTEAGADQRFTNFLQIEAIGQGLYIRIIMVTIS